MYKTIVFLTTLLAFTLFVFLFHFVSASDTTTFQIDVLGPSAPIISLQVPDTIYLGEVHVGEQTSDVKVDINNTGNVGVIVTPQLASGHDDIFHNLYFKRITSEPYYVIGSYSHNISVPTTNGVKSSYMYAKLDLRNYDASFAVGSVNRINSDVKFVAVAQ